MKRIKIWRLASWILSMSLFMTAQGMPVLAQTATDQEQKARAGLGNSYGGMAMNAPGTAMYVGETKKFTVTFGSANTANPGVTWTSSHSRVAAVSQNGAVTAISPGAASIMASSMDGGYVAMTVSVVSDPSKIQSGTASERPWLDTPKLKTKFISPASVKLSWNKIKRADLYCVFRSDSLNGKEELIHWTTGRTFTDKKLTKGKTYYYCVEAIDTSGAAGAMRSFLEEREIPVKLAAPKLKLALNAGKKQFRLSWNKVKDAQKIEIYRSVNGKKGPFKKWKTVSAKKRKATYSFSGLSRGRGYGFKLKAICKKNGKTFRSKFSNMDGFNRT